MKSASLLVLVALSFVNPLAQADTKEFLSRQVVKISVDYKLFDQKIDHFSKQANGPTFKQRYWVDSSLAQGENAPVIYYICGEGTCEGASGTPLVNTIAKKYKAHRIALEHRYYGYSQPYATLESKNLKYLSMDQAIEDLADFQKFISAQLNLKGKWISVGGSYPGEVSAFYRLKHPELVVGALASSAPVLAKADFEEYDRHVARVAGPQCLQAIQTAVADVEQRLKDPAATAVVKAMFKASEVQNNTDFLYVLADMSAIAIQYGYQDRFCSALIAGVQNGNVVKAYADVGNSLFEAFGITSLQDSFQGAMSTDPNDYIGWAGMRSWMYQSCTEFGFYQVAYSNPAMSSRSSQISLAYHNDACKRLFGIQTPVNTDRTNSVYYRELFKSDVKNIFFTNGANDPWSNLSILPETTAAAQNPALNLFTIIGSSHCDDLGNRMSTALTQARTQFDTLVAQWLN